MENKISDEINKIVKREISLHSITNDLVDREEMIYKKFEKDSEP